MDKKYVCYCGLYCENCATKAKVEPAAKTLYTELCHAGFEEIIQFFPNGDTFWSFLKGLAEEGACGSCKEGGGNPGCQIRVCAKDKNIAMCAQCEEYPCDKFEALFAGYPMLQEDNRLLRESGIDAWAQLQDERRSKGYTYSDANRGEIPNRYSEEELSEALRAIRSTISKCEKVQPKLKENSSQHTLLVRRIKALQISEKLIEREMEGQ